MPNTKRATQAKRAGKGSTPTKRLPTPRIAFAKQLDLLRAFAAASGDGVKAVENKDIADAARMAVATVSLANAFFADVGFIVRSEGGYTPDQSVVAFARVHQWDTDKAGIELAPLLRASWFGKLLLPRLQVREMTEDEAVIALANEAAAGPAYRSQVVILLDYLEVASLIVREGGQVRRASTTAPSAPEVAPKRGSETPQPSGAVERITPATKLPLLVQGLLEQLPVSGSWTRREADDWLELARLTFNVVYKIPPEDGKAGGHG